MRDITPLLDAIGHGEEKASGDLLPLVYDGLRRIAAERMAREAAGQTLQPTALVHEAWLRLTRDGSLAWENRAHFFGAASEAMRRILIERARRVSRIRHGGGRERLSIEHLEVPEALPDEKILLVDEALERLKVEDPETAQVVILKFFGGQNNEEIVEITGMSERTVRRRWIYAKTWLFNHISRHL